MRSLEVVTFTDQLVFLLIWSELVQQVCFNANFMRWFQNTIRNFSEMTKLTQNKFSNLSYNFSFHKFSLTSHRMLNTSVSRMYLHN